MNEAATGSVPRLLRCLAPYGEEVFDLLLDFGIRSFEDATASDEAGAHGVVAFDVLSASLDASGFSTDMLAPLMAQVLAMPATYDEGGAWLAGNEAARVIAQVFLSEEEDEDEPTRRARRNDILHFLDTRIDPTETHYTGLAPEPGCALFAVLGGPPGLGRLAGFIEQFWESPVDVADLHTRIAWLERAATDEVKLLVLCSIKEWDTPLSATDLQRAASALSPLLDVPDLASSAKAVLAVLSG